MPDLFHGVKLRPPGSHRPDHLYAVPCLGYPSYDAVAQAFVFAVDFDRAARRQLPLEQDESAQLRQDLTVALSRYHPLTTIRTPNHGFYFLCEIT